MQLTGHSQLRALWQVLVGIAVAASASPQAPDATAVSPASTNPMQAGPDSTAADPPEWMPGELLIRFRHPQLPSGSDRLIRLAGVRGTTAPLPRKGARQGVARTEPSVFGGLVRLQLAKGEDLVDAQARLQHQPEVAYAEPNFILRLCDQTSPVRPDDFELGRQWALENTGQYEGRPGADISALAAWSYTTGSRSVRVAVIDSGIDYFHPDLEANVWINDGEIAGNGVDDDRNGYIDDVHGYDFVSGDGDPMDDQGHGSHVAGIIGAVGDNGQGVAGLCWRATLVAIKAFDEDGQAAVSDVVAAIEYAVANDTQLINASWGTPEQSLALQEAIRAAIDAGVLVVSAAGNGRSNEPFYPSAMEEVVSVAATNNQDRRAPFSNYGPQVDLAAPGELVLSTMPNARYELLSGTSMAAPHVTGVAALVRSLHPEFTNPELVEILRNAVDDIRTDQAVGTGRLNALKAVRITQPLPTARLRLPEFLAGLATIEGTAVGDDFAGYRIEYGAGDFPDSWVVFHEAATPVEDGPLVAGFDTSALPEGMHSFRLVVLDALGQAAVDRGRTIVRNVLIDSPIHNDILRAGQHIAIRGTVFGEGRSYTLEHGPGWHPSGWSSEGIEVSGGGSEPVSSGLLGWWDTSGLATNNFHSLRLIARNQDQVVGEWVTALVHLDGQLRPGWPQYLPSETFYPTNDWRDVQVADLDGDGLQEIVRVHAGGVTGTPAKLTVFDLDGSTRWTGGVGRGEPYSDIPAIGDVDGDGKLEVFAETGEEGRVHAFRHDGSPLGGAWPVQLAARMSGKVLADLDRDGLLELICYAQMPKSGQGYHRQLAVFDHAGRLLADWKVNHCARDVDVTRQFPAVGNFDSDRDLEIVVASACGELAVFDLTDPHAPVWSQTLDTRFHGSPAVGDVDGDGRDEIVIGGYDRDAGQKNSFNGGVFLFESGGGLRPGWPVLIDEAFVASPALADFDHDGTLEILIPSWQSQKLHLLHHDGFDVSGWPVQISGYLRPRSQPLIADIDGDGALDGVMILNGQTVHYSYYGIAEAIGGIHAWSFGGTPIDLHPLAPLKGLPLEQTGGFSRAKAAPLTLTDLDGNGLLDIVASSIDDRGYSSTEPASIPKKRYSLYAWELPVPVTPSNLVWSAFQRGPAHTGYLEPPGRTNQPPAIVALPGQKIPRGGAFFPLPLAQYVSDPDHELAQLELEVAGAVGLVVEVRAGFTLVVTPPSADWEGTEVLTLVARDPEGAEASQPVSFTAVAGYEPPVAGPDEVELLEDTAAEFDVLRNDTQPGGLPLHLAGTGRPAAGRLEPLPDGRLRYTPHADFFGEDGFLYTVRDDDGGLAIGEVRITVLPVPDAPRLGNDHLITDEDVAAEISLLANDVDPDGEALSITRIGAAIHGQVTPLEGDRVRYTPEPDWYGADFFLYRATDGSDGEAEARVDLIVKPVNDPPVAGDQNYTLNRNSERDVFYQASDPDGDELTFTVVDPPDHAELWTYPKLATYYPNAGFVGQDHFTYRARDGRTESRLATVSFTVLDANNPPKTRDLSLTNKVNRPVTITLSATDADEDPLTFEIVQPPAHGSLESDGPVQVYTPEPDFVGLDEFLFRVSDGRDATPATRVRITVTDQNTAPVAGEADLAVRFNTPTDLRLPVTDPESDPLTIRLVTPPQHGELTGEGAIQLYTPEPDYTGPDRFTFIASDGELDSEEGTVRLAIQPRNSRPIVEDQDIRLPADVPFAVPLSVRDPDGDNLRLAILKGPQRGLLSGLGTNYIYRPRPGFYGSDSFTYKAWDGYTYSAVGTVFVVIEKPVQTLPAIQQVEIKDADRVVLHLQVRPGQTHHLQGSDNLRDWRTLTAFEPDAKSVVVEDPEPIGPQRFYRVIEY